MARDVAFFDLSRRMQVILIAAGLAVAPATGCKAPGLGPPDTPSGDRSAADGGAASLAGELDVSVTRVTAARAHLLVDVEGALAGGEDVTHSLTAEGFEIESSDMEAGSVEIELDHSALGAGETGTVVLAMTATVGGRTETATHRIHLCKLAGGLKVLEHPADVCEGPPAQPPPPPPPPPPPAQDTFTQPDVSDFYVDPPPPPPNKDPVPPVLDPAPPPGAGDEGPASLGTPPAFAEQGPPGGAWRPVISAARAGPGAWELSLRIPDAGVHEARVRWSASGGTLSAAEGPRVTWTAPDEERVYVVQAAVETDGEVRIETWRRTP
jgi:hypothetical protein